MALGAIYDIAGSGMTAQSLRMNTTASNIANAQVVAGSAAGPFVLGVCVTQFSGFEPALMILGSLFLPAAVFGFLLKPPPRLTE